MTVQVVVIGGGIGGLSAGIALRAAGFDVRVYERSVETTPEGAAVCMWPNGAKALAHLGLGPALERIAPVMDAVHYRETDGRLMCSIPLGPLVRSLGQRPYPLARSDLHAALLERFGTQDLVTGAECRSVEDEGDVATVTFRDGSRVRGDVVVAADGIKSVARREVMGEVRLRYVNSTWVGLVEADPALNPPSTFTMFAGDGRRVGVQPVSGNRLYCFVEAPVHMDFGEGEVQLGGLFEGWSWKVAELLRRLNGTLSRTKIRDFDPLDRFVRGRIVLLGDAAHAMTPTLSQGAALAVEDAVVLARHLANAARVEDALHRYDVERRARTAGIVFAARERTNTMLYRDPAATERWYQQLREGRRDFVEAVERISLEGPLG